MDRYNLGLSKSLSLTRFFEGLPHAARHLKNFFFGLRADDNLSLRRDEEYIWDIICFEDVDSLDMFNNILLSLFNIYSMFYNSYAIWTPNKKTSSIWVYHGDCVITRVYFFPKQVLYWLKREARDTYTLNIFLYVLQRQSFAHFHPHKYRHMYNLMHPRDGHHAHRPVK